MKQVLAALVLLLAARSAGAWTPAQSAEVGDSLFERGLCFQAAAEYRRALIGLDATPDSFPDPAVLLIKQGLALGATGDIAGAADALRRVSDSDPDRAYAAQNALAGLYVASGDIEAARLELSDLLVFARDSARRDSLRTRLGWLFLQDLRFSEAAEMLAAAGLAGAAAEAKLLSVDRPRSATAAAVLSSFLPGAGEVYAGMPGRGLLALLVTGGSGAATYFAARSGDWVTATVLFSTLFLRFYNGSRANAVELVSAANKRLAHLKVRELSERYGLEPDWLGPARALAGPSFAGTAAGPVR